jgi:hypothetical protein
MATHTAKTYLTSQSLAQSTTATGTVLDHTGAYGCLVTVKITNGGTGPTVAPTINVYTSHTNGAFAPKLFAAVTSSTTNSAVTEFAFVLPPSVMYSRVDVVQGASGQSITVEAFCQELTTL